MLDQSPETIDSAIEVDESAPRERVDFEALNEPSEPDSGYQKKKLGALFWAAVTWLAVLLFVAVFADLLPLRDPNKTFAGTSRQGPNREFWFGNDNIGKDVFTRTIYGARRSMLIAGTAEFIGFMLGGTVGLLAGYYRKRVEGLLMGGVDVLLAFPALILAMVLVLFLGDTEVPVLSTLAGSPTKALICALGILTIPTIARITRAGVLVSTEREYVLASRTLGARDLRIMVREVLPNVLPAMIAYALIGVSFLIIIEAALAFFGLSDLNQPSWGTMINLGRDQLDEAPHMVFFPALFMFLTVLSINYIGDRIRDYYDVREAAI